jgi:hypothetical protein
LKHRRETAENWNIKEALIMEDNIPLKILSVDSSTTMFNLIQLDNYG